MEIENKIIEGYGCQLVQLNQVVQINVSKSSRTPSYHMYPNNPCCMMFDFAKGIKVLLDKEDKVKQINFGQDSGYVLHDKFIPSVSRLSDIRNYHWSFEHMHPGLITSEFYKGVGFSIDINMQDYWFHRNEGTTLDELLQICNPKIWEIVLFSNCIGNNLSYEMYEGFIWEDDFSSLRKK